MSGKYFLFEFPSKEEAIRILKEKNWVVNQLPLFLDRWDPVGCCHREGRTPREAWVRALGLPLHLWGMSVFQKIGDWCGGFISIDEATETRRDLRWAKILVHYSSSLPACVRIGVGSRIFEIPIWAETAAFCRYRKKGGATMECGVQGFFGVKGMGEKHAQEGRVFDRGRGTQEITPTIVIVHRAHGVTEFQNLNSQGETVPFWSFRISGSRRLVLGQNTTLM